METFQGWNCRFGALAIVSALLLTPAMAIAADNGPAPAAEPGATATLPTDMAAPAWLRAQLESQVRDALGADLHAAQFIFQGPDTIILRQVVLTPHHAFGWAELANEQPGGTPATGGGRLTIAQARLVLANIPIQGQPLAIGDLTLERPELTGAGPVAARQAPPPGGSPVPQDGPGVDAGVQSTDRSGSVPATGLTQAAARRQLRSGFDHLDVAVQTLPPTASFVSLRKFLPLTRLVIRGGRIVGAGKDTTCGLDMQALLDPNGEWRFGLALSTPAAPGGDEMRVQTQGYCNPAQGTISMTGVKYLRVGPDGKTTDLDVGAIRLRLLMERGPADGGVPKPRVDTTEIDNLPSQYLSGTDDR